MGGVRGGRKNSRMVDQIDVDTATWPIPDEGALTGDVRAKYFSRKRAVDLYFNGSSNVEIKSLSGIGLSQTYRLIKERCLQTHPDGLIYGWRGLIPNMRIEKYRRKSKIQIDGFGYGGVGALTYVLELYPDLHAKFQKRILAAIPEKSLGETKKSRIAHWRWFVLQLRERGLEARQEWPFNTKNLGYISVCRYIDQLLSANPSAAARAIGGKDLQRKLIAGDGVDRPIDRPFQRVEMDAHKLDGRFCVLIPRADGDWVPKIIHRIWVIVLIDVVSRAVIGYHLSLAKEVSKFDVLRAVKHALGKWHKLPISFSKEAYVIDAGFPSSISDKFVGACWDETSVDGALAETCKHVKDALRDVVQSALVEPKNGFSARRSLDDRPFIEAFFKNLAGAGFQRLTNTTGSKPSGKQGRDPAEIAITSQFQLEYANELLDVLIANYNARPHSSLGYRSPLAYLNFLFSRDDVHIRKASADTVSSLLSFRKLCPVKGGADEGRRPYVNFMGARYSNEVLARRHDLVGKSIWVINHIEFDARVVKSSTIDGISLGILRASPPWHKLPHSLTVRKAVQSAINRKLFQLSSGADAIELFIRFTESQKNHKLPIHPAYLEIRRILIQANEDRLVVADYAEINSEQVSVNLTAHTNDSLPKILSRNLPARRKTANN